MDNLLKIIKYRGSLFDHPQRKACGLSTGLQETGQ
jgi:hypothetical protein